MNDEKIIELLKNNPSEGISCAVEVYGALIKTVASRILGYENKRDIEECVSDVFVELWKSVDKFNVDKGSFKNYIVAIARNVSMNTYNRKVKKHQLIPIEENEIEIDFDVNTEVSKNINKQILNETIANLPQPDKDIFIRRYYLFESVKSIAQSLDLSCKTIENKLWRGKEKLKNALVDKGIII